MRRRSFLIQSALSAGWVALPTLFEFGCKEKRMDKEFKFKGHVNIVGAGMAGLYAAKLLTQHKISHTVFEASAQVGGRIKSLNGFETYPIELGAEEIHGENSIWFDSLSQLGAKLIDPDQQDYLSISGELVPEYLWDQDSRIKPGIEVLNELETGSILSDNSLSDWWQARLPQDQRQSQTLVYARSCNDFGTSADRISVKAINYENREWRSGDNNLILSSGSFTDYLEKLFPEIIPKVKVLTPITRINYGSEYTEVIDTKGVVYPAEKTIVTVPLSILKQGIIQFDPPLPTEKINQFNSFGMDTGIKMFLRFSKTWWPEDMGSIILEDSLPEIWATSQGKEAVLNRTLTVFVMGAGAEILSQLEPQAAVNRVLGRLEYYLGVGLAQDLQKWHIQDWSKEPWIQGAYSYAKAGVQANRKVLRQPVNQQIYFAGEAMNDVHYATVQGAMESAQRAVWEIGTS